MNMSTRVVAFRAPDEKWKKMKAAWDACEEADLDTPEELLDFFDYNEPDPRGVEIDIPRHSWTADMQEGFEIFLEEVPEDVKVIRFYNSY